MQAVRFDQCGEPAEVLRVEEVPVPEPGPGEVRVRMRASPLNPSDILYVQGRYGWQPTFPASAGFEGVGVVEAAGPGLLGWARKGKRVGVLHVRGGTWQEQVVVSARHVVPVPDDIPDEQAASFFVNPVTALVMVRRVLQVPAGAWLLQTAAGSTLGRMIIRLGRRFGFRTLNIIRRREQAAELLQLGADAVVATDHEDIEERVPALAGADGVSYAIDAVGGTTGSTVVRVLGPRGRLLIYGTLADEPLVIDPRALVVHDRIVEGFWLTNWVKRQHPVTMLLLFRQVWGLMRAGVLATDVGTTFPLGDIRAAAALATRPGRGGKVQLRLGSP